MNCIFCQKSVYEIFDNSFECKNCHEEWNVRFALFHNQELDYFCIYDNIFYIEQSIKPKLTRIFKWVNLSPPDDTSDDCWKIYLTIDDNPKVTPKTARSFMNRILKLKSFY